MCGDLTVLPAAYDQIVHNAQTSRVLYRPSRQDSVLANVDRVRLATVLELDASGYNITSLLSRDNLVHVGTREHCQVWPMEHRSKIRLRYRQLATMEHNQT